MSKDAKYPLEPSIEKLLDIPFKDFMPGQIIQSSQFNDDMLDIEDKVNEIITKHNGVDIRLSEHQRNLLNPHCVTATQINAYEVEEVDELINDVKNGNLNDEAITNRVLADACVDNRVLVDGVVTLSKLDTNIGNQIDISNNMSIKERYTKLETDAIIQEKVGDGTYSKEQIDAKFEEYQAGTIVDGTIDVTKFKSDVGRKLDISNNPSISNRYTKSEVNTLIAKNGLPKDWGNLSDEVDDEIVTQSGLGVLPISDVMMCGEFKATETDVLNIKVQDVEFAKGEFNTLEERLDSVDSQLTYNRTEIERIESEIESEINEVIDKINNLELGDGVSNLATKEDLDKLNKELEIHTHEEYVTELELNNKGYLTEHQDLSSYAKKSELHSHTNKTVLDKITNDKVTEWNNKSTFSGNYNDLTNKPIIPTKVSQLTNDSNFLTQHQDISGKADKTELHNHTNKTVLDKITSAKVQSWDNKSTFSGNYNDLTNKPIIPSIEGLATEDFVKNEIAKIDTSTDVVDSIEDMVDTNKQYVYSETNTWWAYKKVTTPAGSVLPNVDNAINWTSTEVLLNKRLNSSATEVDAPGSALFYFNFSKERTIQVDFTPKSSTRYIALTIKVSASSITSDDIANYVITLDNDTTNLLDIGEIYLNKRYSQSGGGIADDGEGLFALIVPLVGDGATTHTLKFENLKHDITSDSGSTLYMLDSNKANASSVNGNSNFTLMTEGVTVVPSEIQEMLKTVDPVWIRMKGCSLYNTNGNKTSTKVNGWSSTGSSIMGHSPYSQILMYEEAKNGISSNPYSSATFPYDDNKTAPVTAIKFGYYNKTISDSSTNGKSSHFASMVDGRFALSLIVNFASATAITEEDLKDVYITFNEPIVSYEEITVEGWYDTGIEYNPNDDSTVVGLGIKVSELEDRVEELEKRPVGGGNTSTETTTSTLPSYWKDRIDEISPKIESLQDEYGVDAFQFLWCSDIHSVPGSSPNNTTYLGEIGRYVIDKHNIPFFTVSGDIMSQASHPNVEAIWTEYDKLNTMFSPIRNDEFLATKGNHDGAWGSPVDGVYYLNNVGTKKLFNTIYRRQTLDRNRVFGKDGTYFYVDYHNVRFYVLNAHTDGDSSKNDDGSAVYNPMKHFVFGNEQLNWIADTLLTVQEGQKVMFMAHPPTKYCVDGSVFEGILNSYKNRTNYVGTKNITGTYWGTDEKYSKVSINKDFTNAKGDLVGYFHGHIHKDTITVDGEYPIISITTAGGDLRDDYLTNGTLTRAKGTPTETAMDLVTVTNDYIHFTRIGSGYDRKYNRATKEITVDYDSAYIPPEKDPLVKPQGSELYLNQQYSQSNGGFVDKNGFYSIIMPIEANTKYMLSLSNIVKLETNNTTLYTLDANKSNATTINGSKYIYTMSGVTFTNVEKTSVTVEFTSDFKSSYAVFVTSLEVSAPISEDNLKGIIVALKEIGKADVSDGKEITSEVIWQENTRYSGSDGKPREFADTVASNDISVKPGDVIRIYGFTKITENYSYSLGYTDDTYVKYHNLYEKNPYDDVDMNTMYDVENNVMTIHVKSSSSINRIRICNYCTDSATLRVFINMELDEQLPDNVTNLMDTCELHLNKRYSGSSSAIASDGTGLFALIVPIETNGNTTHTLKFRNLKKSLKATTNSTMYLLDSSQKNIGTVNGSNSFMNMTSGIVVSDDGKSAQVDFIATIETKYIALSIDVNHLTKITESDIANYIITLDEKQTNLSTF